MAQIVPLTYFHLVADSKVDVLCRTISERVINCGLEDGPRLCRLPRDWSPDTARRMKVVGTKYGILCYRSNFGDSTPLASKVHCSINGLENSSSPEYSKVQHLLEITVGLFSVGVGLFFVTGGLGKSPPPTKKSPTPTEKSPTLTVKSPTYKKSSSNQKKVLLQRKKVLL